jgi:hypothetical protein
MRSDRVWRLSVAQALAVASVGDSAALFCRLHRPTHAAFPVILDRWLTMRCHRLRARLPAKTANVYRRSPGQRVSAISTVTELID